MATSIPSSHHIVYVTTEARLFGSATEYLHRFSVDLSSGVIRVWDPTDLIYSANHLLPYSEMRRITHLAKAQLCN